MDLREKLGKEFVITTELGGTNGTDIAKSLEDARSYHPIDALNVIDCASARLRINSFALAHIIQSEFPELEVIPHLTRRDRSILALQADLLGAHALGIRCILATTGDPPGEGPYKDSQPVFNVRNTERLIQMISDLNRGLDYNGEQIEGQTDFLISAVTAPGAANLDPVIERMKRKIESGADFFQTQPMYDIEKTREFFAKAEDIGVPILLGIMPLRSLGMARYMNDHVAGISIPEEVIERLSRVEETSREEGLRRRERARRVAAEGTQIAREFVGEVFGLEVLSGIHIMALGNVEATNEVIDYVRGELL